MFNPCPKPPKSKKKNRKKVWDKIRKNVVKPMFESKGIVYCEVTKYEFEQKKITKAQAMQRNFNLSYHHRHKRDWYKQFKNEEEMLGLFEQVLSIGQYYHDKLEKDAELTRYYFEKLRSLESN